MKVLPPPFFPHFLAASAVLHLPPPTAVVRVPVVYSGSRRRYVLSPLFCDFSPDEGSDTPDPVPDLIVPFSTTTATDSAGGPARRYYVPLEGPRLRSALGAVQGAVCFFGLPSARQSYVSTCGLFYLWDVGLAGPRAVRAQTLPVAPCRHGGARGAGRAADAGHPAEPAPAASLPPSASILLLSLSPLFLRLSALHQWVPKVLVTPPPCV